MKFKTVDWVRRVRDRNHQETKDMTFDERAKFYRKKSKAARERIKQLKPEGTGKSSDG